MNRHAVSLVVWVVIAFHLGYAQEQKTIFDFSHGSAAANHIQVLGAGFGAYPLPVVSFTSIPQDNAFPGATDGKGIKIEAKPGEGVLLTMPAVQLAGPGLVRCAVRTDTPENSVVIGTIDQGTNTFVATNTANNGAYFVGQYKRINAFCQPGSTIILPVIQIINTGKTETLTACLDTYEVFSLNPDYYYSARFLNGGETDPGQISAKPGETIPQNSPATITIPLDLPEEPNAPVKSKPLEMVLIQPGTFTMGSPETETYRFKDEGPQHQVTITKPFYMGKYEVTQAQWQSIMGNNPSYFKGNNLPVEQINWEESQTFIQKLNQLGLGTFRLPTEAEWEYACRAGTTSRFYWGEDLDNLRQEDLSINNYAWTAFNARERTHDAGLKAPNAWELYDMSGNVFEWCQDWLGDYSSLPQIDPTGPDSRPSNAGSTRVFRGGCWRYSSESCRSANRIFCYSSDSGYDTIGFRLVRSYP